MSNFSLTFLKIASSSYFCLTVIFFVQSFIGILHHELWLDESHHWLLARDSTSINDLITNTKYEGHPILWNVLLFFISRFSLNPFWMQLLHIVISSSVVFVFLKKTLLVNSLSNILKGENQSIIFISLEPLVINQFKTINDSLEYKFLKSFHKNTVSKENYYLYEISKN